MSDHERKYLPVEPNGIYDATLNPTPGNVGVVGHERNAAPGHAQQIKRITAKTGADAFSTDDTSLDVSLHDSHGNRFSPENPLFVSNVSTPGTPVIAATGQDVTKVVGNTVSSLTHSYTVPVGKIFYLTDVAFSGTGRARAQVDLDGDVKETKFVNPSMMNADFSFDPQAISATAGQVVNVVKANLDSQDQTLYSTIKGYLLNA